MFPNDFTYPPTMPGTSPAPRPPSGRYGATDRDIRSLPHADYDLRPLRVNSLDHYVIPTDRQERFHVS